MISFPSGGGAKVQGMATSPGIGAPGAGGAGVLSQPVADGGDALLESPESSLDSMLPEVILARNIRLIEALRLDLEVFITFSFQFNNSFNFDYLILIFLN